MRASPLESFCILAGVLRRLLPGLSALAPSDTPTVSIDPSTRAPSHSNMRQCISTSSLSFTPFVARRVHPTLTSVVGVSSVVAASHSLLPRDCNDHRRVRISPRQVVSFRGEDLPVAGGIQCRDLTTPHVGLHALFASRPCSSLGVVSNAFLSCAGGDALANKS